MSGKTQRREVALARGLSLLAGGVVAWLMLWGLGVLLAVSPLPKPPALERTQISLVQEPPQEQAQPAPDAPADTKLAAKTPTRKTPPKKKQVMPRKQPAPKPPPPPKPQEQKPKPPAPKMPEQPMKMVEQDPDTQTQPPEQADFLANVDRKVVKQTRAKDATLDSSRAKESAAPKRKARKTVKPPAKRAPAPKRAPRSPAQKPRKSLLAMRGSKAASPAKAAQKLLQRAGGTLHAPSTTPPRAGTKARPARRGQVGVLALAGSRAAMQAAIGSPAPDTGRKLAPPQKAGVWDAARRSYESPLDNVVPEVQAGNQTALNSRRHPFAQYIATMHREIHAIWGEGVLKRWDALSPNHAWNDFSLWTRVEIVLWPTGEIDSVRTVRRSGNTSFDGVARNSIYNAGPYPEAPMEIRSGNGKVYIHWAFHRNAYACGTFGAQPFILDNAGHGPRPDPSSPIDADPSQRPKVYGPVPAR